MRLLQLVLYILFIAIVHLVNYVFAFTSNLQSLHYANHAHLPTFCNLVHLELGLDKQNGLLPLPYLLESSPKLEVLVFREVSL